MDDYGKAFKGKTVLEKASTLPAHAGTSDEGRLLYALDTQKVSFGDSGTWGTFGGDSGSSGTSGTSGVAGTSGTSGSSGVSGSSGTSGSSFGTAATFSFLKISSTQGEGTVGSTGYVTTVYYGTATTREAGTSGVLSGSIYFQYTV